MWRYVHVNAFNVPTKTTNFKHQQKPSTDSTSGMELKETLLSSQVKLLGVLSHKKKSMVPSRWVTSNIEQKHLQIHVEKGKNCH